MPSALRRERLNESIPQMPSALLGRGHLIETSRCNTVEMGASHSLLLPWGFSGPKQQGDCCIGPRPELTVPAWTGFVHSADGDYVMVRIRLSRKPGTTLVTTERKGR